MVRTRCRAAAPALCAMALSISAGGTSVWAAEGGTGFYLLGSRGPMAGFVPPPGVYLQNDVYFYSAKADVSRSFPLNGQIVAGIEADVGLEMPTILWSTPISVLNGNLALSVTPVVGGPSLDFDALLSGPLGNTVAVNLHDSIFTYGDPVLSAMVGWHRGNFHWLAAVAVNVPIGDYRENALANVAFNRWAADILGALTWLDPKIGLDLSVAAGVTFNGTNDVTQYHTGDEFHVEWSAEQHLSKQLSIGFVGYYYHQLTADSGSGAVLGPFKGRTLALGGTLAFNFEVDRTPWSLRLKAFKDLEVKNRLEGTAAFLTLSVPLHVATAGAAAQ